MALADYLNVSIIVGFSFDLNGLYNTYLSLNVVNNQNVT